MTIHALPGMGADNRMFPGPWKSLPGFQAHDWPRCAAQHSLPEVARTVCQEYGIRHGDILIGASLGGMIACEIAKLRDIEAIYLVGSATSKAEIRRLLAILHPLARFTPFGLARYCAGVIPLAACQVFARLDAAFVRNMCAAIFKWEGIGSCPVRCFRIHGRRDLIIPLPSNVDLLLDGGHMISMTHAEECVGFIRRTLTIPK
jgi:pimeloyl-ACP methyl ester carboxylesterase